MLDETVPHLKPRNMKWSQNQVNTSMSTMLGKEKPNQLAKLITPLLSGKSLKRRSERWRPEVWKHLDETPIHQ